MNSRVLKFYQEKISSCSLLLDEDTRIIHSSELTKYKEKSRVSPNAFILGFIFCGGMYCTMLQDASSVITAGVVVSLPIAYKYLRYLQLARKEKELKNNILKLLSAFKSLHKTHREVMDYVRHFMDVLSFVSEEYMEKTQTGMFMLVENSCEFQMSIVKHMQDILSVLKPGLDCLNLELVDFENLSSNCPQYNSPKQCLDNGSIVEGQILLLRSHLLTSIYLMCSSNDYPNVRNRLIEEDIPLITFKINSAIAEVKKELNLLRFPDRGYSKTVRNPENTLASSKRRCSHKIEKNLNKLTNNISMLLEGLQAVCVDLEEIEYEEKFISLEEQFDNLTDMLLKCYISSSEIKKLLEILNGRRIRHSNDRKHDVESPPEENMTDETDDETILSEKCNEPGEDVEIFGTEDAMISDEEDTEETTISAFNSLMSKNQSDWLIELAHSEEFRKRKDKLKSKRFASTPVSSPRPNGDTTFSIEDISSIDSVASKCSMQVVPIPPPLPAEIVAKKSCVVPIPPPLPAEIVSKKSCAVPIPPQLPVEEIVSGESCAILSPPPLPLKESGKKTSSENDEPSSLRPTTPPQEMSSLLRAVMGAVKKDYTEVCYE